MVKKKSSLRLRIKKILRRPGSNASKLARVRHLVGVRLKATKRFRSLPKEARSYVAR